MKYLKVRVRMKEIRPTYSESAPYSMTKTLEENVNDFLDKLGDRFTNITFPAVGLAYILYIEEEKKKK